jgi:hypothetical protein
MKSKAAPRVPAISTIASRPWYRGAPSPSARRFSRGCGTGSPTRPTRWSWSTRCSPTSVPVAHRSSSPTARTRRCWPHRRRPSGSSGTRCTSAASPSGSTWTWCGRAHRASRLDAHRARQLVFPAGAGGPGAVPSTCGRTPVAGFRHEGLISRERLPEMLDAAAVASIPDVTSIAWGQSSMKTYDYCARRPGGGDRRAPGALQRRPAAHRRRPGRPGDGRGKGRSG